jgi:hypothetical protein
VSLKLLYNSSPHDQNLYHCFRWLHEVHRGSIREETLQQHAT